PFETSELTKAKIRIARKTLAELRPAERAEFSGGLMKARQLWLLGAFAPVFAFAQNASVTVNATTPGRVVDERLFGANSTLWDSALGSNATQSLLQAAGLRAIRLPGGSLSDEYHWRINTNLLNTFKWVSGFDVSA